MFVYFLFDNALSEYMDYYLDGWVEDVIYAMNKVVYAILFSILVYKIVKPEITLTKTYIIIIIYMILWIILRFWIIGYVYGGF